MSIESNKPEMQGPEPQVPASNEALPYDLEPPAAPVARASAPVTTGAPAQTSSAARAAAHPQGDNTDAAASTDSGVISEPAFPGPRVLVIVGVTLSLIAMILAATQPGPVAGEGASWVLRAGRVLVTLFDIAVHTGTGMVAVLLAAMFLGRRVGGVELAAARMLVAVSACVCVMSMPVDRGASLAAVVLGLRAILALGAYWLLLLALFRRSVADTNVLAAFHVAVYLVMVLGTALHSGVQAASAAGAGVGAGGSAGGVP